MVGEIRDSETANIAIHAALTGHLVLSTLHTETAGCGGAAPAASRRGGISAALDVARRRGQRLVASSARLQEQSTS